MSKKKKEFKQVTLGESAVEEFHRPRWKHYLRWLIFCFVVFLYLTLLLTSYNTHVILHRGFVLQELIVYILCTIMMIPIVPSVFLEVDYVKVSDDTIELQNLLFRRIERWEDIKRFDNPLFLKFAILRTKSCVYLLNRRDLQHFDKLIETIEQKKPKLIK